MGSIPCIDGQVSLNFWVWLQGGDPYAVYEYLIRQPVPDDTCQVYEAKEAQCEPYGRCETCHPGKPPKWLPGICEPVCKYKRYSVRQYGHVHGGKDTDVTGRKVNSCPPIIVF
jgi:cathepsin X